MPKFRKKPVVIDAERINRILSDQVDRYSTLPGWVRENIENNVLQFDRSSMSNTHMNIKTLNGTVRGELDDYLIKGINGELYPCKPDIFKLTYEAV